MRKREKRVEMKAKKKPPPGSRMQYPCIGCGKLKQWQAQNKGSMVIKSGGVISNGKMFWRNSKGVLYTGTGRGREKNGKGKCVITSGGKMGIGVATPAIELHVRQAKPLSRKKMKLIEKMYGRRRMKKKVA